MVGLLHNFELVCWNLRSICWCFSRFCSISQIMPRRGKSGHGRFTTSLDCANANGEFSGTANENVEDMFVLNNLELNTQENVPQLASDGSPSLCSLRKRA